MLYELANYEQNCSEPNVLLINFVPNQIRLKKQTHFGWGSYNGLQMSRFPPKIWTRHRLTSAPQESDFITWDLKIKFTASMRIHLQPYLQLSHLFCFDVKIHLKALFSCDLKEISSHFKNWRRKKNKIKKIQYLTRVGGLIEMIKIQFLLSPRSCPPWH